MKFVEYDRSNFRFRLNMRIQSNVMLALALLHDKAYLIFPSP